MSVYREKTGLFSRHSKIIQFLLFYITPIYLLYTTKLQFFIYFNPILTHFSFFSRIIKFLSKLFALSLLKHFFVPLWKRVINQNGMVTGSSDGNNWTNTTVVTTSRKYNKNDDVVFSSRSNNIINCLAS